MDSGADGRGASRRYEARHCEQEAEILHDRRIEDCRIGRSRKENKRRYAGGVLQAREYYGIRESFRIYEADD